MGERTDQLGDYEDAGYNPNDPIPPDDALMGGAPGAGAVKPEKVDVTDRYAALEEQAADGELASGADVEEVDVTDRDFALMAEAEALQAGENPLGAAAAAMGIQDAMGAPEVDAAETAGDTDQIRSGIEETRAGMSQTIDEIQERLNPRRLARQATETMREATIGRAEQMMSDARGVAQDAGQSLWTAIRENPIPATLAGLGLGWLLYKTWGNLPRYDRYDRYDRYGGYRGYNGYAGEEVYDPRHGDRYVTGYDGLQYPAPEYDDYYDYGDGMEGADERDTEPGATDRMQEKASQMAGQVSDQAQRLADQAQTQARRAQGWLGRSWDENPLVMGALALAAGAVIGLSIPETEPENRLMGSARDSFMDKAQGAAQKAQVVAQRAASAAASAATDAARDAAQDEARKQGLAHDS